MGEFAQQWKTCTLRMRFTPNGRGISWTTTVIDPDGTEHELRTGDSGSGKGPKSGDWISYAKRLAPVDDVSWFRATQTGKLDDGGVLVEAPVYVRWGKSPEQHADRLKVENDRLRALVTGLIRLVRPDHRDHACAQCVAEGGLDRDRNGSLYTYPLAGDSVVDGFVCARHEALALTAGAA